MIKPCIRPEKPEDISAITSVIQCAFGSCCYSDGSEDAIVIALRETGALSVSLVAELESGIAGHIAFSRVRISDASPHWYGLGPLAVAPEFQHRGIGGRLVRGGFDALRSLGAWGCVVLGEPDYYARFGFQNRPECLLEGVPPEYFLALAFSKNWANGTVSYHEAFNIKSEKTLR